MPCNKGGKKMKLSPISLFVSSADLMNPGLFFAVSLCLLSCASFFVSLYLLVFIGSNEQAWTKLETSNGEKSNSCLLVVTLCRRIGYFEWSTPLNTSRPRWNPLLELILVCVGSNRVRKRWPFNVSFSQATCKQEVSFSIGKNKTKKVRYFRSFQTHYWTLLPA